MAISAGPYFKINPSISTDANIQLATTILRNGAPYTDFTIAKSKSSDQIIEITLGSAPTSYKYQKKEMTIMVIGAGMKH